MSKLIIFKAAILMFVQTSLATVAPLPKEGSLTMGTRKSGEHQIHSLSISGDAAAALYVRLPEKDQKVFPTTSGSMVVRSAKNISCSRSSNKIAAVMTSHHCRLELMDGKFGNLLIPPNSNAKPQPKPTVVSSAKVKVITSPNGLQTITLLGFSPKELAPAKIFETLSIASDTSGAAGIKIETKQGKYVGCQKTTNQKIKQVSTNCMFSILDGEVAATE